MRPCIERHTKEEQLKEFLDDNGMHLVSLDPLDDNFIDKDVLYFHLKEELERVNKRINSLVKE